MFVTYIRINKYTTSCSRLNSILLKQHVCECVVNWLHKMTDHSNVVCTFPTRNYTTTYLKEAANYAIRHRRERVHLMCNRDYARAVLIFGPLEDTEYKDKPGEVRGCSEFYLPTTGDMEVVGYAANTPYPCDQLILLVREDEKLYGYDGDEVHLLANSLKQLIEIGLQYPPVESYYYGEAFRNVTMDFWDKASNSPRVKAAKAEHYALLASRSAVVATLIQKSKAKRKQRGQWVANTKL